MFLPYVCLAIIFMFVFLFFFSSNLNQLFMLNGLFNLDSEPKPGMICDINEKENDSVNFLNIECAPSIFENVDLSNVFSLNLIFFFLLSLVITSIFCMLSFKKLMNSLIHLILIFMVMGLLLLLLNFDFLAVLTLLIYVGAIMVFFLFAILLLLKFFSFKVMTISKNKLISTLDFFLITCSLVAIVCFLYSISFTYNNSSVSFIHSNAIGYLTPSIRSMLSINILLGMDFSLNGIPIKFDFALLMRIFAILGLPFIKGSCDVDPFIFSFLFTSLCKDVMLTNLSLNLAELDMIHVYGLQLYVYYGFLLIASGVLLSIVIFAALKISKPFKAILVTKHTYK